MGDTASTASARCHLTSELCGGELEKGRFRLRSRLGPLRRRIRPQRGVEVMGLDFASDMARRSPEAAGVADRRRFASGVNCITLKSASAFDFLTIPVARFLQGMRSVARVHWVLSFPIRWMSRLLTRRLGVNDCPVLFYGERQVQGLLGDSGWGKANLPRLSRDYSGTQHAPV